MFSTFKTLLFIFLMVNINHACKKHAAGQPSCPGSEPVNVTCKCPSSCKPETETPVPESGNATNNNSGAGCPIFRLPTCDVPANETEARPDRSGEIITDPYVECPALPSEPPLGELLYSTSQRPEPNVVCEKCDLRITDDKGGVVVQCFGCVAVDNTKGNRSDILYKAEFIQIAEYSRFNVTGLDLGYH